MYRITSGNNTLWSTDTNTEKLLSPKLSLELNKIGSLSFTILPNHSAYNALEKLKSVVTVYQDDDIIFRGRIFSDSSNFRKAKTVETEGVLGFFNDSVVRPYSFTGTLTNYLNMLITQHNNQVGNDKKFTLGNVTVRSPNWWNRVSFKSENYPTTWEEINNKLLGVMGGYIVIRYTETANYIDYLADASSTATQKIQYAVNLLDLKREIKANDFATRIIPLGAASQDDNGNNKRLTISSVNSGKDYVNDAATEAVYGIIAKTMTWDDITSASDLLSEAKIYLATMIKLVDTLTIKAVDLHLSDDEIQAFRLGHYINVYSEPHGVNENMLLSSYSLDLSDPTSFTFSLGKSKDSYIKSQFKDTQAAKVDFSSKVNDALENIFNFKTDVTSRFGWGSWKSNAGKFLSIDSSGNVTTKEITEFNIDSLSALTSLSDSVTLAAYGSNSNRKVTWSTIKSALKTYFDTLYAEKTSTASEEVATASAYSLRSGGVSAYSGDNVYQGEESVVGSWFGELLYRRVIEIKNLEAESGSYSRTHGIEGLSLITKIDGIVVANGATAHMSNVSADLTDIFYTLETGFGSRTGYLIIEYTKTE